VKGGGPRHAISRNVAAVIVAVAVLAVVLGYLAIPSPTPAREKVFYIVVYHWGFALYDQNFNEINRIQVSRGDRVTLHVIPAEALTEEAHGVFEERTVKRGIGNLPPNDPKIMDEIEEAEKAGLMNHSVTIIELGVNVSTDISKVTTKAHSVKEALQMGNPGGGKVTFTADKVGSFNIMCMVPCGFGHAWMMLERGFVVL
jgi:hypothetical protein